MIDKDLYIEVANYLALSGGTYRCLDSQTCRDVIDALHDGCYRIVRDAEGNIISFTSWWMISEPDIELVKNGGKPNDTKTGDIVYIADHAGACSMKPLTEFVRDRGVCWHNRYKQPGRFRYFPRTKRRHV